MAAKDVEGVDTLIRYETAPSHRQVAQAWGLFENETESCVVLGIGVVWGAGKSVRPALVPGARKGRAQGELG